MSSRSTAKDNLAPTSGTAAPPIRALVVDDHDVVREGLTAILEHRCGASVVGSACNGEQALFAAQTL